MMQKNSFAGGNWVWSFDRRGKRSIKLVQCGLRFIPGLFALTFLQCASAAIPMAADIQPPVTGDHALHILTPTLLELFLVNTKQPNPARVDSWDWVNDQQNFVAPDMSSVNVIVNGQTNIAAGIGFKRRPLYAPLLVWDLRIGNELYLRLSNHIADGASVQVINNGTL